MFNQLCEFYSKKKANNLAIDAIGEAVYFLKNYHYPKYIKNRTLNNYAKALKDSERYFEASEIYQLYWNQKLDDQDIREETMFLPNYLI